MGQSSVLSGVIRISLEEHKISTNTEKDSVVNKSISGGRIFQREE